MEALNRIWDIIRLARAMRKETKAGPVTALKVLGGEPLSRRYLALWQTFYVRLRVLSRYPPEAELSPLRTRDWFRSPASETEQYCRLYVLYLLAYTQGEEGVANLRRSELKALDVLGFVRSALIVT